MVAILFSLPASYPEWYVGFRQPISMAQEASHGGHRPHSRLTACEHATTAFSSTALTTTKHGSTRSSFFRVSIHWKNSKSRRARTQQSLADLAAALSIFRPNPERTSSTAAVLNSSGM